jgi:integrase
MFRRMTHERYLTDPQLARFMTVVRERRHPNQPRDHALFGLLANTGIRPGEALALTRGDVFLREFPAWIRVKRLKKRKLVPEWDDIELSDDLALVLAQYVVTLADAPSIRVFHMNRRSLQRVFKLYAHRAGLRTNLYALRHTAATRMYIATRDIEMVQAMLGHENRDTSTIYAHIPHQLLLETVNTMPVFV